MTRHSSLYPKASKKQSPAEVSRKSPIKSQNDVNDPSPPKAQRTAGPAAPNIKMMIDQDTGISPN